jgi:hypothetical protein
VQLEGAQRHRTGLQIDLTGTDGVLRITKPHGFENKDDNTVMGMAERAASFSPLAIPAQYEVLAKTYLDPSVQDVAHRYATYGGICRTAAQKRLASETPCGCTT